MCHFIYVQIYILTYIQKWNHQVQGYIQFKFWLMLPSHPTERALSVYTPTSNIQVCVSPTFLPTQRCFETSEFQPIRFKNSLEFLFTFLLLSAILSIYPYFKNISISFFINGLLISSDNYSTTFFIFFLLICKNSFYIKKISIVCKALPPKPIMQ